MKKLNYVFLESTETTQDDAHKLFMSPSSKCLNIEPVNLEAFQPVAVVSEVMTSGRGRVGRKWVASVPGNLNISIAFDYSLLLSNSIPLTTIPIVVGVAVARSLGLYRAKNFRHKWPNDILIDGRKAGGILIEVKDGVCVVGIGANIFVAPSVFDVTTTSLHDCGLMPNLFPNLMHLPHSEVVKRVAVLVGDEVWHCINSLENPSIGYSSSVKLWSKHSWKNNGDIIDVKLPCGDRVSYIYHGLNTDGTLSVAETNGGGRKFLSYGDVS